MPINFYIIYRTGNQSKCESGSRTGKAPSHCGASINRRHQGSTLAVKTGQLVLKLVVFFHFRLQVDQVLLYMALLLFVVVDTNNNTKEIMRS